jgi:DNA-binding IclR family transcriptional regulator
MLLLCADYAGSDEAALTHESLAALVGLQRTTVTTLLGEMVQQGLIRGGRGRVRLLDRPRLERLACSCYRPRSREAALPGARIAEAVHG